MLILHAGLVGDDLLLWGESPPDPTVTPRRGGRRPARSATPAVPPLPFGASEAALRAGLGAAGLAEVGATARATNLVAWLPTLAGTPVASSPLIAEVPAGDDPSALAPWSIAGLPLTGASMLDLLVACRERSVLAPGVVAGADLAGWAAALRLAGALIAHQQVLPDIVERAGDYYAAWTPLVAGADADRLTRLAAVLPPVARALTADAGGPPATPAAIVLGRFLALVVDALIRATAAPSGVAMRARRPSFASLHDQWLHALSAPDGRLTGAPDELAAFADQVRAWQRPVVAVATAPYRLCLRLEEPATTDDDGRSDDRDRRLADDVAATAGPLAPTGPDGWYVRYLLQAADDPSLLLPAAEVWQARGAAAARLRRGEVTGREVLLAALGQAASLAPEIAASLRTATPAGYPLDSAGAYRFLTDQASLLEAAGVGVLLPAWWTGRRPRRLAARARVRSAPAATTGRLTLDRLVAVDWTVALGEATLSVADLEALAAL
jgi:hypothetical protein